MQKNKAGKGAGEKERQSGVGDLDLLLRGVVRKEGSTEKVALNMDIKDLRE